jgi:hypothetical protein
LSLLKEPFGDCEVVTIGIRKCGDQKSLSEQSQNGLTPPTSTPFLVNFVAGWADGRVMIVKRTTVPGGTSGGFPELEIFVAECEACAFSAVSRYEGDAIAIVERHQSSCSAHLAAKAASEANTAARETKGSTTDQRPSRVPKRTVA